jgi:hypothetical protein
VQKSHDDKAKGRMLSRSRATAKRYQRCFGVRFIDAQNMVNPEITHDASRFCD